MSSVNPISVREQLKQSQSDFQRLLIDGKLPSEAEALFSGLLLLLETLVAIFLERTTKKTNKNSSKPSSQTKKDESSTVAHGSHGRGKEESGERFSG